MNDNNPATDQDFVQVSLKWTGQHKDFESRKKELDLIFGPCQNRQIWLECDLCHCKLDEKILDCYKTKQCLSCEHYYDYCNSHQDPKTCPFCDKEQ